MQALVEITIRWSIICVLALLAGLLVVLMTILMVIILGLYLITLFSALFSTFLIIVDFYLDRLILQPILAVDWLLGERRNTLSSCRGSLNLIVSSLLSTKAAHLAPDSVALHSFLEW